MPEALAAWTFEALLAMGVSATTAATISFFVLDYGATALMMAGGMAYSASKAKQAAQQAKDAYNAAQVDRLVNVVSTIAPRELVMGRVRKAGTVFYRASTGKDSQDLYLAIALAGHEIDAIEGIYLNDVLVTMDSNGNVIANADASPCPYAAETTISGVALAGLAPATATNVQPIYRGGGHNDDGPTDTGNVSYQLTSVNSSVKITQHLGSPGQVVDAGLLAAFPDDWASTAAVQGIAYLVVKLNYNETAFPSGVPNVTAVIRGAKLFDPRTGTTVWGENPALMMCHVYTHPKFGKATITATEDARLIAAANACDQSTTYTVDGVGSTHELFRASIVLPFGTAAKSAFDDLSQAMGGSWAFAGGEMYVKAGVYVGSVMSLTDADLAVVKRSGASETQSPISISVHKERAQKFNSVKAQIWDAAQDYKQVSLTPLTGADLVTRDGAELVQEVTFPAVGYAPQAQHIAGIMMRDARDALVVDLPFKLRAYPLELFDTVALTLTRYGWSAKTFMILSRTWNMDGSIQLTLKETAAAITQMDSGFSPQGFAANTNLPAPWILASVGPLTVTTSTATQKDGTVVSSMTVAWTQVADMAVRQNGKIEVQYRPADSTGSWTSLIVPGDETQVTTTDVTDGIYYVVRARAKTTLAVGDWNVQVQTLITGKTTAPTAPTATATGGMFCVNLAWTFGDSTIDILGTEIWWSGTDNRSAAARLSFEPYPATAYSHIGLSPGQGGYYWLRVGNSSGVLSAWYPTSSTAGMYAVASTDATALLAQLNANLDIANLTAGLTSRIDLIDGNTTQPALPYPLAKLAALQDGLNQTARRDLDTAGTNLLDAITTINATQQTVHDAGITTNPDTGVVTIYGLELAKDHLNTVDITLDAHAAAINLRATAAYVDGQIAAAVLSPADLLLYDGLDARMNDVSLALDAANGNIALKSSTIDLTAAKDRITNAEVDIDSLQGQITLKVSTSEFDTTTGDLVTRMGTAESSISALGDTSVIIGFVSQSSTRLRDQNDDANTMLRNILNGEAGKYQASRALSVARTELYAHTEDGLLAEATQRSTLAVAVEGNLATLTSQQNVIVSNLASEVSSRLALASSTNVATGEAADAAAAAQSAADAAAADAIAQANLAVVTASAYADGIVTIEEERAIADATAKANAAHDAAVATAALDATAKAKVASDAAAGAQAAADSANTSLANLASDGILSPVEKPSVVQAYAVITTEQSGIDAQATAYDITTEKTTYDAAITALTNYLGGLTGWNTVPGSDVVIVGTTFRSKFADVYTAKQSLLNKFVAAAKVLADSAQHSATVNQAAIAQNYITKTDVYGAISQASNTLRAYADKTKSDAVANAGATVDTLEVSRLGYATLVSTGETFDGDGTTLLEAGVVGVLGVAAVAEVVEVLAQDAVTPDPSAVPPVVGKRAVAYVAPAAAIPAVVPVTARPAVYRIMQKKHVDAWNAAHPSQLAQWNIGLPIAQAIKKVYVTVPAFAVRGGLIDAALTSSGAVTVWNAAHPNDLAVWMPISTAAVEDQFQALQLVNGKLMAKRSLKVDNNGHVTGMEIADDGTSGSFVVLADKFLVAKPDGTGTPIPMMSLGTVNGVTALGLNGDLIIDGSMSGRSLNLTGGLSALTSDIGTMTTGRLQNTGNTNYINLSATGTAAFLNIGANVAIRADGSGYFARELVSAPMEVASGGCGNADVDNDVFSVGNVVYVHTGINIGSGAWNMSSDMYKAAFAADGIRADGPTWHSNHDVWMIESSIIITPGYVADGKPAPTWTPTDGKLFSANGTSAVSSLTVTEGDLILRFCLRGVANNDAGWSNPRIVQFLWSVHKS